LSCCTDSAEENSRHHNIHISIIHNDDGIVSTKLKDAATEPISDGLGYISSHSTGAGGRDARNPPIARDPLAERRAISHNQGEYPLKSDLICNASTDRVNGYRRQWCKL
jgi:hypothetical protein